MYLMLRLVQYIRLLLVTAAATALASLILAGG